MQPKFSIEAIEFQIASEVRCDEEGKGFYTIRGTARLAGIDDSGLSKSLSNTKSRLYEFLLSQSQSNIEKWKTKGIPKQGLILILSFYAFGMGAKHKQIEKAYQSLCEINPMHYKPKPQKIYTNKKSEKDYQMKLAKKLDGKIEVPTLAGNIDVLTSTQLIEIKRVVAWKDALGQVLIYGHFYPSHQKRIHLFGETQESYLNMIKEMVFKYDVIVTWEA